MLRFLDGLFSVKKPQQSSQVTVCVANRERDQKSRKWNVGEGGISLCIIIVSGHCFNVTRQMDRHAPGRVAGAATTWYVLLLSGDTIK